MKSKIPDWEAVSRVTRSFKKSECYIVIERHRGIRRSDFRITMDLTHIHLLLNHFPTIGYIIGGGLFLLSLIAKSDDLKRASLAILLGIALIALPTYMSGNGAGEAIKSLPGVSKSLIETHESAALVAIGFMLFTGAFAVRLGLWQFRRLALVPRWNLAVILVLTLVSLGLMTRASNLGGEIRHAEIRAESTVHAASPVTSQGNRPGGEHYSGRDGARFRYQYAVDVAYLRNPALRWPEPFGGCGVYRGPAGSGSDEGRVLRLPAPSFALGRAGIWRERGHWYFVFRGDPGPVHKESGLLLENRTGRMLAGLNALYFTSA